MMDFQTKLQDCIARNDSLLCVGLDPDPLKLPLQPQSPEHFFDFARAIIDATADLVCAFKPNSAFYEATGSQGIDQLQKICDYIRQTYPQIPIILDYKRADIGNTNLAYADFAFKYLQADAVTLNPYMGSESLRPFLDIKDKGLFMLCRTSNKGASEFQDLEVNGQKLYQVIAKKIAGGWNGNHNCALVVGATNPSELKEVRQLVGEDMWLLLPGIGAQGGDAEAAVKAGMNQVGSGIIINASRSVLYASGGANFAKAARTEATTLRDTINQARRVS